MIDPMETSLARNYILKWGVKNQRSFSWRLSNSSYEIFISEFLLHRTRACQVSEIYDLFIKRYPNFEFIAETSRSNLREDLKPIGLNWRIDALYDCALRITHDYMGILPLDKTTLLSLPGVGEYIASAVVCFSTGSIEPVLDTNIVRFIGRFYGLKITDSSRRNKRFKELVLQFLKTKNPRQLIYFLIDFAFVVCTPSKPKCTSCLIKIVCNFGSGGGIRK
jgi:A/G-specific adenine glycosylase